MLTDERRDEFDRCGIVRMPGAIAKSAVDEMLGVVWGCLRDRYHIHRGAAETWPEPQGEGDGALQQIGGAHRFLGTHRLPKSVTFEQVGNAAVRGALDDLLGAGNWEQTEQWGQLAGDVSGIAGALGGSLQQLASRFPGVAVAVWTRRRAYLHVPGRVAGGRRRNCFRRRVSLKLIQSLAREGAQVRSAEARMRLIQAYPWVKALCSRDERADRVRRFMSEGTKSTELRCEWLR